MRILLLIAISLLASCSCDWHLKKAKSKCNYEQLTEVVTVHDTTYVDRVTKDTLFKYYTHDTVIVREGRLTMKYFYNHHDSTVYLKGVCDTVKIVKEIQVPITKEIYTSKFNWIIFAFVVLIILLVINQIRK